MSNPVMVALAPNESGPGVALACQACGHHERFAHGKAGTVELMQTLDRHLGCRPSGRPAPQPRPSLSRARALAAKRQEARSWSA